MMNNSFFNRLKALPVLLGASSILISSAYATSYETKTLYNEMGRVTMTTTPDGNYTVPTYNTIGQVTATSSYTAAGVMFRRTETDYLTTTRQPYQTFGPECFDYPAGTRNTALAGCDVTTIYYDALGRAKVVEDAENRKTKTIFYDDGRTHKIIKAWQGDPTSQAQVDSDSDACTIADTLQQCYVTYTYTDNGNEESVKDANGNLTAYFYNPHDRLEKIQLPHPTSIGQSNSADYEHYTYDDNGNMTQKRKRDGKIITMAYDGLNRVKSKSPQSQSSVSYAYDLTGRQTDVDFSGGGHLIHNEYDTAGRLWKTTDDARLIKYDYDDAGNRTEIRYPGTDGFWVQYVYDNMNRVETIKENGAAVLADYTYNDEGRRSSITLANGTLTNYSYHDDAALKTLAHNMDGAADDVDWTYGFNKVNQLTSKALNGGANLALFMWQPDHSKNDTYTSNGLNQYTNVANNNLQYDLNGNLKSDAAWIFSYNTENMLVTASKPDVSASYIYDSIGRRSAKTTGGKTTTFLHDGVEEIADYDGAGAVKTLERRYVHGPGVDEYLVMYTGATFASSTKSYFHANHQGSIIALSDSSGAVGSDQYTYSAYGLSGDDITTGSPFRYTGRRLDPETGLYYYRARYYSPAIGRFLQTDPIGYGDGLNWYAYVGNDPLNKNDPTGLNPGIDRRADAAAAMMRELPPETRMKVAIGAAVTMAVITTGGLAAPFITEGGLVVAGTTALEIAAGDATLGMASVSAASVTMLGRSGVLDDVGKFMADNAKRFGKKLGDKIGRGDLPAFTPGREGLEQAKQVIQDTLENATKVSDPFVTVQGKNTVVDVFSKKTGNTVRIRENGAFETLIPELTKPKK